MSAATGGQRELIGRRKTDRSRDLLRARRLDYDRLEMPQLAPRSAFNKRKPEGVTTEI